MARHTSIVGNRSGHHVARKTFGRKPAGATWKPRRLATYAAAVPASAQDDSVQKGSQVGSVEERNKTSENERSGEGVDQGEGAQGEAEEQDEEEAEGSLMPPIRESVTTVEVKGMRVPVPVMKWMQYGMAGVGSVLLLTLTWSIYKVAYRSRTKKEKKRRTRERNRLVINEFEKGLSGKNPSVSPLSVLLLRARTGFSYRDMFRKYFRFVLNEKPFDEFAIARIIGAKAAMGVSDQAAAQELREAARRIVGRYGALMLNPKGMTTEGLRKKAQGTALFAKMLYLAELDGFAGGSQESQELVSDLMGEFRASQEDVERLRNDWQSFVGAEESDELSYDEDDEAQEDADGQGQDGGTKGHE